jgi:hypothetical protein
MSAPTQPTIRTQGQTRAQLVRPVDALERLFYRYAERNPAHFAISAEFDMTLTEAQLRTALQAVQQRHPLLSVHVEDRPGSRLGFYRAHSVAPISLTMHECDEEWLKFAAAELAQPFDRSTAPLMRAVLLNRRSGSTILLTFDHTIADGISSIRIMADLVTALNGKTLAQRPVPASVEERIARTRLHAELSNSTDAPDARMSEPTSTRPFDGTHPYLHTAALGEFDTARLVTRCRAEKTTVHAAILTVASRVHATLHDKHFVRALSPIDVRPLLDIGGDCADYFMCTITGMAPRDGTAFWDQARAMTAHLSVARSGPSIAAMSATIRQEASVDAECALAEQLFTVALPFDLLITNLGVQELVSNGPIKPAALWGPVLQSQADDFVIGIVTYAGRLRMTSSGYTPCEGFLHDVAAALIEATQR